MTTNRRIDHWDFHRLESQRQFNRMKQEGYEFYYIEGEGYAVRMTYDSGQYYTKRRTFEILTTEQDEHRAKKAILGFIFHDNTLSASQHYDAVRRQNREVMGREWHELERNEQGNWVYSWMRP